MPRKGIFGRKEKKVNGIIEFCILEFGYVSSNINEVIKGVSNFFFHDKILHAQIAQKECKASKSTKRQF